jgi:hypothetical protein
MGGSPKFALAADDWQRIAKGFLIAGAGFLAAFLATQVIPALAADQSNLTNMALTAACSVVVNALRLYASDTR